VSRELSGVFAGDVVLVGVMFEDDQIPQAADERDLTHFLLEAQEEKDPVVFRGIDITPKIIR
jgi:hypothetical protein